MRVLGGAATSYRLSTQDAGFLYAESVNAPLHIGSIAILDGHIGFEELIRHLKSRIHLIPRYRQRLAKVPFNLAHAIMEDDPDFRVENHIFRHSLPKTTGAAAALSIMMRDYGRILPRERPLWDVHLYEGFEGGRSALVWRVHHCLVDGVSGVELLKVMYDFRPDPEPVPPAQPWKPKPPSSAAERFLAAAQERLKSAIDNAQEPGREMMNGTQPGGRSTGDAAVATQLLIELGTRKIAQTPWNSGVVTARREIAWTRQSFGDFRLIRSAFGGSVNDVVLTILTAGAARYLDHHGYRTRNQELCVGCPVNVRHRTERSALGNRVSMMFPRVCAEVIDVVERLRQISAATAKIKAEGSAASMEALVRMAENVPPALAAAASKLTTSTLDYMAAFTEAIGWKPRRDGFAIPASFVNFVATNVPGVQVPLYMLGKRCLDMIPVVPLWGTLGYGVAVLSYNRNLYFGLIGEPRLIPDVARMRAFVDEAFFELKRRAYEQTGSAERAFAKAAGG